MKCCALNLAIDGLEDHMITCFKLNKSCHAGSSMLEGEMAIINEPETNPFEITESDVEEAVPENQLIDEDNDVIHVIHVN